MKPTLKTGLTEKRKNKDAIMSKPAIRAAIRAKAAEKNVSVPKSALDNFVDTYKATKVGPIQRKIASFISGMNTKADYTNPKSTTAKMTTKAQSNRAKSQGGRTRSQAVEANQVRMAGQAKASKTKSVLSNLPAKASQKKADTIAAKDANMGTKKSKNYNVGVSKGGVPFKEAFAHFRKKGAKTFTWNGKKYTTELAKKGKK